MRKDTAYDRDPKKYKRKNTLLDREVEQQTKHAALA